MSPVFKSNDIAGTQGWDARRNQGSIWPELRREPVLYLGNVLPMAKSSPLCSLSSSICKTGRASKAFWKVSSSLWDCGYVTIQTGCLGWLQRRASYLQEVCRWRKLLSGAPGLDMNEKPQEQAALGLFSWSLPPSLPPWFYASVIHTVLFSLSTHYIFSAPS